MSLTRLVAFAATIVLDLSVASVSAKAETLTETFAQDDLYCMALNVFWEARSEPIEGQYAVAAVTLNRVRSPHFPDTICEVVKQGGYQTLHRCQFSWWCDGKRDEPQEPAAWSASIAVAVKAMYSDAFEDPTDGAVFYHADYIDPFWADYMTKLTKIGLHIFYVDDRHGS